MKFALSFLALSLTLAVNAQAADRKIANMIAVERSIDNVYQACVDQVPADDMDSNLFSCKFSTAKTALDFTAGTQSLLAVMDADCTVEASVQNSVVLVLFSSHTGKKDFAGAKACLQRAVSASKNKDSFKFYVYTLE
ncbi:hypothetical protein [Bdellovibrio sp. HCB337]|uniref:hypothetical protein n=1 Tax=Bdellovibrio sp. HCB337 TaxID=3394358 RepID=UPI0039A65920